MRRGTRIAWLAGALVVLTLFVSSALAYYRAARKQWLTQASTAAVQGELQRFPNDPELAYVAARRLWEREGKPRQALPLARKAVSLDPRRPEARLLLGYVCLANKLPAEALYHFERACALQPDLRHAHSGAGAIYVDAGMPDAAIRHLELAWDPKQPEVPVRLSLVEAHYQKGNLEQAERLIRESLAFAPPGAFIGYQQLYRIGKRLGRAESVKREMYEKIRTQSYILTAPFYAELSAIVLDEGGPGAVAEAERLARKAIQIGNGDASGHEALGLVRARQGRISEALAELRRALASDPTRASARRHLERLRPGSARPAKADPAERAAARAIRELRAASAASPQDEALRLRLADALARGGSYRDAFQLSWADLQDRPDDRNLAGVANRALAGLLEERKREATDR